MRYDPVRFRAHYEVQPDPSDFLCDCGAEPDGGTYSAPTYSTCTCGESDVAEQVAPRVSILDLDPND